MIIIMWWVPAMRSSRRTFLEHKIVRGELHTYCGTLVYIYTHIHCTCLCVEGRVHLYVDYLHVHDWAIARWIGLLRKLSLASHPPSPTPPSLKTIAPLLNIECLHFYLSLLSHSVPPRSNTQNILSYLSNILRNSSSLSNFVLAISSF